MNSNQSDSNNSTSTQIKYISGASLIGIILLLIEALVGGDQDAINNRCKELKNQGVSTAEYTALNPFYKNVIGAACGIVGPCSAGKC